MGMYIGAALIAYFIGSINFSVIISKKVAGFDVREKGSKNAGTTNMLRTVGKKSAALVLICDILKGVIAILLAKLITQNVNQAIGVQIAAVCVVLGHTFPIFFEFKGGKGVATSIGVLLMINWQIGLICLAYGILMIVLTKFVSLGSICAAILFPILTIFVENNYIAYGANYIVFGFIMAVFILINHRENIKRLNKGTENRISFSKKAEESKA